MFSFDACQKWKDCLDAMTDGELAPEALAVLQTHLQSCADCQSFFETSAMRRAALRTHSEALMASDPSDFDAGIIAALRVQIEPEPLPLRGGIRLLMRSLPTDFLQQMAGGTLAAAALTIVCLFTALHPKPADPRRHAAPPQSAHQETPVALEELLRAHSPRAASLWSSPAAGSRAPRPAPAAHRPHAKDANRRGSVPAASGLG